jgi:hypothetical protein
MRERLSGGSNEPLFRRFEPNGLQPMYRYELLRATTVRIKFDVSTGTITKEQIALIRRKWQNVE